PPASQLAVLHRSSGLNHEETDPGAIAATREYHELRDPFPVHETDDRLRPVAAAVPVPEPHRRTTEQIGEILAPVVVRSGTLLENRIAVREAERVAGVPLASGDGIGVDMVDEDAVGIEGQ